MWQFQRTSHANPAHTQCFHFTSQKQTQQKKVTLFVVVILSAGI